MKKITKSVCNVILLYLLSSSILLYAADPTVALVGVTHNKIDLNITNTTAPTVVGTKVQIFRSLIAGTYSTTPLATLTAPLPATFPSYSDITVLPNTTYFYKVTAVTALDAIIASSNEQTAKTLFAPVGAPTSVNAINNPSSSSTSQIITWLAPAGIVPTGYNVYNGTAKLNTTVLPATQLTFTSPVTLNPGANYCYQVEAVNGTVTSTLSAITTASCATTALLIAPAFTAGTLGVYYENCNKVGLRWVDLLSENGYEIRRSVSGANNYIFLVTKNQNEVLHIDNTVTPGVSYDYIIRANYNVGGSSQYSPIRTVSVPASAAPTNFVATKNGCSMANLSWTLVPPANCTAESYKIFRALGSSSNFVEVGTASQLATGYLDRGLVSNQSYSYFIKAQYATGPGLPSNVQTITTDPLILTKISSASTTAEVAWTNCSTDTEKYQVWLQENGAQGVLIKDNIEQTVLNYKFTNLKPETSYGVYVRNGLPGNNGYGVTNLVTFTTTKFPGPTDLKITNIGTTSLKLNWKDNSNSPDVEEFFQVLTTTDNGANFTSLKLTSQNATEFIHTGLKANQKVCYVVRAGFGSGFSGVTPIECAVTCPDPIESMTAKPVSSKQIDLAWPAITTGATKVVIESSADNITFTKLAEVAGTETSYKDMAVSPGQKKYYRIAAGNEGKCLSAYTTVVSTSACSNVPTDIVAKGLTSSEVEVNWTGSSEVTMYIVYRSNDNIGYEKVAEVAGPATKFIDTKLKSSKEYYYKISAKNEGGCESDLSIITINGKAKTCPAGPSGLVVVANSAKEVKLTFTDNSPDELRFEVEVSKDEKAWVKTGGEIAPNTTTIVLTSGIDPETKYFFRVRAIGEICTSDYSNTGSVTTNPLAPTGLTAKAVKINQIDLAWTNGSKTANGIEIQRAGADNVYAKIADVAVAASTYQNTAILPATAYKYRVRNKSLNGDSEWSNIADATTFTITDEEGNLLGKSVSVFPNPVVDNLNLKAGVSIVGKVRTSILNIVGKETLSQDFNNGMIEGNTYQINVSALSTGLYFLEVSTEKGKFTKKFMKQ